MTDDWDPQEKLACDLMAAERFIQAHQGRDGAAVAYAKKWLAELEAEARALLDARPRCACGRASTPPPTVAER